MSNIITVINIFLLIVLYITNTFKIIYYYQNDNYHLRVYKKFILYDLRHNIIQLSLLIFVFLKQTIVFRILLLIILVILIIINKNNSIFKLKITNRIKRLIMLNLFLVLITLLTVQFSMTKILIIINVLYLFISLISSIISSWLEMILNYKYIKESRIKLKKYQPTIIGITGSCGKTSVKNYIYEATKKELIVYKSPKSYNTLKGLSITINNYLKNYNSVLLLEMGLSHKNDIKKITNNYKPNISIITEILPSHLQTMKTIDNIIHEKMQIIQNMEEKGLIIVNGDNEYIINNVNKYNLKENKIIKVGINSNNDYVAKSILIKKDSLEFDIHNNIKNKEFHVSSKTVGRHNIYNILITYAILEHFNIDENNLNCLENHENRLEIKKYNKMTVLNDSYNSNINGFLNALEVLSLYETKKVIITPGIVEGGKMTEEMLSVISKKIAKICDFCYIIDNKNTPIFIKKFKENNYENYVIKPSFLEAFNEIKNDEITLLIENDLTDYYYIK